MSEDLSKKYSKVSPALKSYFLENLYYQSLSIRESALKCRINYSTAKIILRDLNSSQKKFVKKLLKRKENDEKWGLNDLQQCRYRQIQQNSTSQKGYKQKVEIISRVGFDFFSTFRPQA